MKNFRDILNTINETQMINENDVIMAVQLIDSAINNAMDVVSAPRNRDGLIYLIDSSKDKSLITPAIKRLKDNIKDFIKTLSKMSS